MAIKATVNRKIDRVVNLAPKIISIAGSGVGFDTVIANGTTIVTTVSGTTLSLIQNNSIIITGVAATGKIYIGVANASITSAGQVQLNDTINSTSLVLAATANSVNTAYNKALAADTDAVAAFVQANTAGLQGLGAFVLANTHTINITAAFAKANLADQDAIAAFGKANTADLDAIAAFAAGNTNAVNITAAFAKANIADLDAIAAFASGNTNALNITSAFTKANIADIDAIAAFASGNTNALNITAAFAKANLADQDAIAAFGTANAALPKAGGTMSGSSANIIFDTKNTGIYWTSVGGGGSQNFIYAPVSNVISFGTANIERMKVDQNGTLNVYNAIWISDMNVYPTVVAAFAAANAGGGGGSTPAFQRANNSWGNIFVTGTDSTYNWTISGNNGITANNSANTVKFVVGVGMEIDVDAGNNAVRFVTGAFGVANTALNVAQSAFATANAGGAGSVIAVFQRANNSWGNVFITGTDSTYNWSNVSPGNIGLLATNSANTIKIINGAGLEIDVDAPNNAIRFLTGAFSVANTAQNVAQSAFAAANAAGGATVQAAFARANNSWGNIFVTGTDSTYNWSNVTPGNIGLLATNSANTVKFINGVGLEIDIDQTNNAIRFMTGAFAKANIADLDAIAAFAAANTADLDAIAAFGTANAALPKAGGTMTANIIFNTKNTGIFFTSTGGGGSMNFIYTSLANQISFGTSNVERMRLESTGILNVINAMWISDMNVYPTIVSAFFTANSAQTDAATRVKSIGDTMTGNLVFSGSNIEFSAGNTGIFWNGSTYITEPLANTLSIVTTGVERLRIDSSGIVNVASALLISNMNVYPTIQASFLAANTAQNVAQSAFAAANVAGTGVQAAFARANNSWGNVFITGTDSTYNWSNVSPGNIGLLATNSANTIKIINGVGLEIDIDAPNNAIRFLTGAFAKANIADTDAIAGLITANAAFSAANSGFLAANSAFARANNSWGNIFVTGTDSTYNWSNVSPGNIGLLATNLANTVKFINGVGLEIDVDAPNNAIKFLTGAFSAANTAQNVAQSAFAAANAAGGATVQSAFARANASWSNVLVTGTDSTYNWTIAGNIGITATNSANTVRLVSGIGIEIDVDQSNNAVRFTTGAFSAANSAFAKANNAAITGLWFHIDGGGQAITTGKKMYLPAIPFGATIVSWTIISDASCNANIELWKSPYATFPVPTVANTVHGAGSCYIILSNQQNRQNTTLDNWSTTITANDTIAVNVNSVDTATFIDIMLKVLKT